MGMTIDDCIKMLIAKETCIEREISGIDTDCNLHNCDNCSLCYEQGTMGEQKMALLFAVDTMRKYQMFQADYENRLKADKVAMLEELKKEMNPIKECEYQIYGKEHWNFVGKCQDVVQQKIDELKAESEG